MNLVFKYLRLYEESHILSPPDNVERYCWRVFFSLLLALIIVQIIVGLIKYISKKQKDTASNQEENTQKALVKKILISFLVALLFFGIWEGIVRYNYEHYQKKHPFINPVKRWTLQPNLKNHVKGSGKEMMILNTNSEGLRNSEVPEKKKTAEIRILCMGDSWTIGQSVREDKTYPKQLEKMLKEKYPHKNIRVINGGMFGYSILQGYNLFQKLGPLYKPDIVILGGFNDMAAEEIWEYEEEIKKLGRLGFIREFLGKSIVYLSLRKTISRFRKTNISNKKKLMGSQVSENLCLNYYDRFFRECEKQGIKVIAFEHVGPYNPSWEYVKTGEGNRYYSLPYAEGFNYDPGVFLRRAHRRYEGIDFYSIQPDDDIFEINFYLEFDKFHPSPIGHRAIAETLFSIIADKKLIQ